MAATVDPAQQRAMRSEVSGSIEPRFSVGQKFMTAGKHPREMTVTDILRTYNLAGDLVRVRYVAQHVFMGQVITDHDVIETSIARRAITSAKTSAMPSNEPPCRDASNTVGINGECMRCNADQGEAGRCP